MTIVTGWVEAPKYKSGLDPLGVQQPCIAIYTALLPGITNVTDRIKYYGFGPWFAWAFAQRNPRSKASEFIEMLRRAEVLLTLIGVRHALTTDDGHFEEHAGTLVGVNTLREVGEQNKPIRLSDYTVLKESPTRYFKNRRGGLGQYYLGVLRDEYKLLDDSRSRVIDFTLGRGDSMAKAVAAGVDGDHFFRCLASDRVTSRDLESLSSFCPCQLRTAGQSTERTLLLDTIFGRSPNLSENADARRRSLALIIEYLQAAKGSEISFEPTDEFLAACYARVLPNGRNWLPSPELSTTASLWAFYLRSELYSIAMQRLFREALIAIEKEAPRLPTVEDAGRWCASTKMFTQAIRQLRAKTYKDLLTNVRANLPALDDTGNERHEIDLWARVVEGSDKVADDVEAAGRLIITLIARHEPTVDAIEHAIGADRIRLDHYPINLDSIAKRARARWDKMTVNEWIADTLCWVLATHRQVAFRKLSQSGDDTRRLRMGDEGLYVDGDTMRVVRTQPRLRPALRFLRDLGLVEQAKPNHLPIPSRDGINILQQATHAK